MSAFYLALLAVLVSGIGARDQITVAGLARHHGARPGILFSAIVVVLGTAAFAGWAATLMIPVMQPNPRVFLCAMTLVFAAAELLLMAPKPPQGEPTHSLGALTIVLLSQQLTDAARFVVFGIAVAMNAPLQAAAGGALGGMALMGWAWVAPQQVLHPRLRMVRRIVGVLLVLIAAYVAMRALDRI